MSFREQMDIDSHNYQLNQAKLEIEEQSFHGRPLETNVNSVKGGKP